MLKDVSDRLVRLEAARDARSDEREKGTAKGLDFEEAVEARLDTLLRGTGDLVEPTGTAVGNSVRGRKGDFLITLDPSWTRGLPVRVAVEAKSGRVGLAKLCRDLDETRRNRDAVVAVAVYRAGNAPAGCAPFTLHGEHIICELDPDDPDDTAFTAAVRLSCALALVAVRSCADVVDAPAIRRDLDGIRTQLNAIAGMKSKLTSISTATGDVRNGLRRAPPGRDGPRHRYRRQCRRRGGRPRRSRVRCVDDLMRFVAACWVALGRSTASSFRVGARPRRFHQRCGCAIPPHARRGGAAGRGRPGCRSRWDRPASGRCGDHRSRRAVGRTEDVCADLDNEVRSNPRHVAPEAAPVPPGTRTLRIERRRRSRSSSRTGRNHATGREGSPSARPPRPLALTAATR